MSDQKKKTRKVFGRNQRAGPKMARTVLLSVAGAESIKNPEELQVSGERLPSVVVILQACVPRVALMPGWWR